MPATNPIAASLKKKNDKVISKSLSLLKQRVETASKEAFGDLLIEALNIAMERHEVMGLEAHLGGVDESYAWVILHNGMVYKSYVYKNGGALHYASMAQNMAKFQAEMQNGWCGVLIAGMSPAGYFKVEREVEILKYVHSVIRHKFPATFKKYSV